ncbi:GNAT family N-acetyltransferase [Acidovorax sp. ACV01]|uniref:GNAT family N-acetyltransferase n=1 Tax=Acidovorax sp. ACV01 TaxID=2769311 RepID=UPI0017838494|nr:GNAT family N-acetyltransferase [Acidovorax sp. ACV01]MBD9393797.1 GNAT family N-acetyltransferase [Acidovorax sp. ACV01]
MNARPTTAISSVQIRPLVAADAVAYKALRDEALRTAPDAFTSDYESSVGRDASEYVARFGTVESGQFFLGAFDAAGQLLGCLGCEREQRTKQRHCAVLVGMMVSPGAQRQGIGQQLVAACVAAACRVPGLTQLVLTVTASNTHVVHLYEQAGFRAWGLLPRAIVVDGVGFDKLHMVRVLIPDSNDTDP